MASRQFGNRHSARPKPGRAKPSVDLRFEPWPRARMDAFYDLLDQDLTFGQIAQRLKVTRSAVAGKFKRMCDELGWQAS